MPLDPLDQPRTRIRFSMPLILLEFLPMRRLLTASLLAVAPRSGEAAIAQPQQAEAAQATQARITAERLLAELRQPGSMAAFVAGSFTQGSLARTPAAEHARVLDQLKARPGGFHALEWRPQGERMIEVIAVSKQGGHHARFVLFTTGKEPGKIIDNFVLPERDPARASKDAFPTGPAAREEDLVRLIPGRIDALAEEGSFSGAVLLARGDRVLVRDERGMAEESWRIPSRADTRFNIASIAKMWSAVVILELAEEGRLSLEDPLSKWVRAFPHQQNAAKITLRHLLQHRAGLGEWDGRNIHGARGNHGQCAR